MWDCGAHKITGRAWGGFSLSETERHLGVVEESASLNMSWFPENIVLTQARYPQSKKSLGGSEQQKKICCLGLKLGNPHQPLHSTMSLLVQQFKAEEGCHPGPSAPLDVGRCWEDGAAILQAPLLYTLDPMWCTGLQ